MDIFAAENRLAKPFINLITFLLFLLIVETRLSCTTTNMCQVYNRILDSTISKQMHVYLNCLNTEYKCIEHTNKHHVDK